MNKKIIFFENRPDRPKIYLPGKEGDQERLYSKEFNFLTHYQKSHEEMINNNELEFLLDFDLIIIHRTFLNELSNGSALNRVIFFCQNNGKDLILFSGGISSSSYVEAEDDFNLLLINSKDFYSSKLIPFLLSYSKCEINKIIELKYGKSWKLGYLLRLREIEAQKSFGDEISDEEESNINRILRLDVLTDINLIIELQIQEQLLNYE